MAPLASLLDFLPEEPMVPVPYYEYPEYMGYIRDVENAGGVGKSGQLWYEHKSPEGGRGTIGYGHKLVGNEDYGEGLTDRQVDELLVGDLKKADDIVRKELGADYGKLDRRGLQMLNELVFNMGTTKKFPKFVRGLVAGDEGIMGKEYKRSYKRGAKRIPLTRRNRKFAEFFKLKTSK